MPIDEMTQYVKTIVEDRKREIEANNNSIQEAQQQKDILMAGNTIPGRFNY